MSAAAPTTPNNPVEVNPTVAFSRSVPADGDPRTVVTPGVPTAPRPAGGPFPVARGYEFLSVVGSGGMGIVYEARHRELNRRVAIKTLRGEALADPEFRDRFRAEAEAIARLQHPNVIQVFEVGALEPQFGDEYPRPFLALEFVDGGSLLPRARSPQDPRYAAKMVETLARAAHAAHLLGVVHRDLKPANVLLSADGEPKIADFGIAKQLGPVTGTGPVTRTGIVMGTPEYMAPEQLEGRDPTPLVDVYALGVILYQLLTGRVPFQGAGFADTMRLALEQPPVPPHQLQPGIPRDLETICLKSLEKSPAKRYASAEALADDLYRWANGLTIRARAVGPVGRAVRWA
ncbi:MAG: serine/threonine protein kinase, partial [Gemmataceae bacterium]|nr:serine/threonine protein kinase [Gemmataceae bacterium]